MHTRVIRSRESSIKALQENFIIRTTEKFQTLIDHDRKYAICRILFFFAFELCFCFLCSLLECFASSIQGVMKYVVNKRVRPSS